MPIRIAVAHRFRLWAESLSHALAPHTRFALVGLSHSGETTVELVREQRPELLVLDPFLPDKDGLDLVEELLALQRGLGIVATMAEPRPTYFSRLIQAGVKGLVSSTCGLHELTRTLLEVHQGKLALPSHLSMEILGEMSQTGGLGKPVTLSNRELQVLHMIAGGASKQEISAKLCISIKTVDSHRHQVLKKLGLRHNVDMAHYVLRQGRGGQL